MISLEILAPARNADIGISAIRCGADAVYIGGPSFGARSAAGNSIEDIERLCHEASRYGVRIYVTVNTLARTVEERDELVGLILSMKDKGISAFIMQDETLPATLSAYGPWKEEFHASTQCTITSVDRAQELVRAGFSRLILERQLSLQQIREIRAAIPSNIELECFVHGALCVCYSGACYLSEHLTGRSANRGACSQPCRSRYDLLDSDGKVIVENSPLLSLKDLNLSSRLADLAEAGVVSFKIEGRLKDESYVKNIVRYYSNALDKLVESSAGSYVRNSFGSCRGGFTPNPDKTFNRGYTDLYIDGHKGSWNSGAATKGVGEYLGTVHSIEKNAKAPSFLISTPAAPSNGDGLCVEMQDGTLSGFRADKAEAVGGGLTRITCKSTAGISRGSRVWRNSDIHFEKELESRIPSRLMEIGVRFSCRWNGNEAEITLEATREDGVELVVKEKLDGAEVAGNQERIADMLRGQIGKAAGIFTFRITDVEGTLPMMSSAAMNDLRRKLATKFDGIPARLRQRYEPLPDLIVKATDIQHVMLESQADRPLMVTRYCILSELGLCLKTEAGRKAVGGRRLSLRNNGKCFALNFDCKNCSMSVCYMQKK